MFFLGSFQQQVTGSLTPYVTSAFSKHSLLSTTSIMSSIIGAVAKLPVAKIIDIWGRAEGYIMMVTLTTLGGCHLFFITPYTLKPNLEVD